jgi:hypothetical protein
MATSRRPTGVTAPRFAPRPLNQFAPTIKSLKGAGMPASKELTLSIASTIYII